MEKNEFEKSFIEARRAAISTDFGHLNDMQLEAVLTLRGPLLLLAGAGSGKTTVLINRIANLLNYGIGSDSSFVPAKATQDDLDFLREYARSPSGGDRGRMRGLCSLTPAEPWRIMAITFTNKAAGEMKERLSKLLGAEAESIWAMTFHAACARMLRRDIDKLGYERSFTIYDTSDAASLMKRILKDMDIDEKSLPHKTVLSYISRAKGAMETPESYLESTLHKGDIRRQAIGKAYMEYTRRMRDSGALDFDDLLLLTVRLLAEHPDVADYYRNRFDYILIDEYQDTNNLQYVFASTLAGGHGNICVVGDDDQSIYKFRGATIENILSFEEQFTGARVIRLEQNYRSTGHILDAAGDVIGNNIGRKGKKLWTEKQRGIKPALHIVPNERSEASFVAQEVQRSAAEGRKWQEHAILYRMNAQSNQLETAFKRSGIPYRVYGGTGFYERAEIKDMLAYLCVIQNPHDDLRLLRIINNPPRGIGQTTVGRLFEEAARLGLSIFEFIREAQNNDALKASAGKLHQFADMIDFLRAHAADMALSELYELLLEQTRYKKMLEEKKSDDNTSRVENIMELKTNIIAFENGEGGSLFDFLSETALYTDQDRDDDTSDRVLMMTMHSAKGLEFDTVFVVGAEEGVFPGIRVTESRDDMEEERRLCYVAMTRAMRRLVFTSARQRTLFGRTAASAPSRFVQEVSAENIDLVNEYPDYSGSYGFDSDFSFVIEDRYGRDFDPYDDTPRDASEAWRKYQPRKTASSRKKAYNELFKELTAAGADYKAGDRIIHSAYGRGMITKLTPAGGDALLEVVFDDVGTKQLLLNSAARFMGKSDE